MNKLSSRNGIAAIFCAAVFVFTGSSWAAAADRFSVAVGTHDMLVVVGPKGDQKDFPLPSISQAVSIEGISFQVSFGRDANDLLTAIIAPNPSEAQDLHFNVLNKAIDSDKQAVVTLTFSKNLKAVKIDPGYVGVVEVNSHKIRPDSAQNHLGHPMIPGRTPTPTAQSTLTDSAANGHQVDQTTAMATVIAPAPAAPVTPAAAPAPTTPAVADTATNAAPVTPVPTPAIPVAANQPSTVTSPTQEAANDVSDHAPEPMQVNTANQMPFTASATPGPSTVASAGPAAAPKQHSLFWAEPITPPSGIAPKVGLNEMKLVEVQGSVTVTAPGGGSEKAQDDTIVPTGSTISTSGGSSAALFMGGINSIRLLPDSEVKVTQEFSGSLRKTVVYLNEGTVFSRVGHRDGETQKYAVETPEGAATAKGTEFADSRANGHHYVFVVKGIVQMLINGLATGTLTALPENLASGAMPPATDGNKILFSALSALQPFQSKLQKIIADINNGTATPQEIAFYNNLKNTFTVMVDDVYDPTHPNAFLGAFTSQTGFGDSTHSSLERPQDFANPNPLNSFNGILPPSNGADPHPFFTPAVTPTFSNDLPQIPPS